LGKSWVETGFPVAALATKTPIERPVTVAGCHRMGKRLEARGVRNLAARSLRASDLLPGIRSDG